MKDVYLWLLRKEFVAGTIMRAILTGLKISFAN